MNSPIYPIILGNLHLPSTHFAPFHPAPPTPYPCYSQSLPYSHPILYTPFPNYLLTTYPLYPAADSLPDVPLEPRLSTSQEEALAYSLPLHSTKSFSADRDSKPEASPCSESLKLDQENSEGECLGKSKVRARGRRGKARGKDTEYIPNRSERREPRKRINSNENRNVIPNEVNQLLSFIQKRNKSQGLLRRVWEKYPPPRAEYSISRFYLLQNHLKERIGHYSNEASLQLLNSLIEPECRIWPRDQQRHYIMLSRVLIGRFLREDSIFAILTSKRMKREKKLEHLRTRRVVACLVKDVLSDYQH